MLITKTILQFQYKPIDFLEAPFQYSDTKYTLIFASGNAEAILSDPYDIIPETLQREIKNKVLSILSARMLFKHEFFELDSVNTQKHYADGSISTSRTIEGKASIIKLKSYAPDIILKDSAGRIIKDTKAERIAEEEALMRLIADSADRHPLINKFLESYKSAVSDPPNELVHLFEILDGLKSNYGTKEEAIKQLGLSEPRWNRLHVLSNNEPLKEGRHRGSKKSLRHASYEELSEARKIAHEMIQAFVSKI
jgi:hypothetical protein